MLAKDYKNLDQLENDKDLIEERIKEEQNRSWLKGEWHIPGYKFCGPGTKIASRIMRGDKPINELDEACEKHDLDYMTEVDNNEGLIKADEELVQAANKYITDHPSFWDTIDRLAAEFVAGVFKTKGKIEKSGVWKPTTFANILTGGDKEKEKKIGRRLKSFLNLN